MSEERTIPVGEEMTLSNFDEVTPKKKEKKQKKEKEVPEVDKFSAPEKSKILYTEEELAQFWNDILTSGIYKESKTVGKVSFELRTRSSKEIDTINLYLEKMRPIMSSNYDYVHIKCLLSYSLVRYQTIIIDSPERTLSERLKVLEDTPQPLISMFCMELGKFDEKVMQMVGAVHESDF